MSFDENDLIERLHAVADEFEMRAAPPADDMRRGRRRVRRNRGLVAGAAAAALAVVIGTAAAVGGQGRATCVAGFAVGASGFSAGRQRFR